MPESGESAIESRGERIGRRAWTPLAQTAVKLWRRWGEETARTGIETERTGPLRAPSRADFRSRGQPARAVTITTAAGMPSTQTVSVALSIDNRLFPIWLLRRAVLLSTGFQQHLTFRLTTRTDPRFVGCRGLHLRPVITACWPSLGLALSHTVCGQVP